MTVVLAAPSDLTLEAYDRVVYGGARLELDGALLAAVDAERAAFLRLLEAGAVCYGVNTGFGAMVTEDIPEAEWGALQRNVLRGRAGATGPAFPRPVARGAMLARLGNFLSGHAAVSAALCRFVADRINDGFVPWIPSRGLGMAGEIIPLCHMAQSLVGDGFVMGHADEREPAADALAARGLAPYAPQAKEGLALVNGVAASPAYARHVARATRRLAARLGLVAAATVEAMAAPAEPYDAALGRLRREPGLAEAATAMRRHLAGSRITRRARQGPISLRVIPQVHGALIDALDRAEAAIADELVGVSDNPVFIAADDDAATGRILATGTFHNVHLTAALEALALALAQAGILSERRLHRLLDTRFSGLAHQLSLRPGMDAGLIVLQKAVLGLEARLKLLAAPVSLHHGESSFGQEDVMPMIFPVIDRLDEMVRLVGLIATYELYGAAVALEQRDERAGDDVEALRRIVRTCVPPYTHDRPYGPEIETLEARLAADDVAALAATGAPGA